MDPDIQRTPLLEGENRGVLLGKAHLSHFSPPPGPLYAHTSRKFSLSFPKARGSIYYYFSFLRKGSVRREETEG